MNHSKYCFLSCILLLQLVSIFSLPASANSARSHWEGTKSTGAIIIGEDCPVVVEHEQLTFDIRQFPKESYRDVRDFIAYSGSVTAEYTFCNPADYTVDATLVFPFGAVPEYGHIYEEDTNNVLRYSDTDKYDISVNGEAIQRTLRHTFSMSGNQFSLDDDMSKLHDGFMDDPFYSSDMTVTRYTYKPEGIDFNADNTAAAAFVFSEDPSKAKVLMEKQNGIEVLPEGVRIGGWVDKDQPFVVNVIGEPLSQMPDWKFYEDLSCEKEIHGTMKLVGTETTTLKEFLMAGYEADSDILDFDWYNAKVTCLNYFDEKFGGCGAIFIEETDADISQHLMRWYEYEISMGPGERIVNTVTAPIYPNIESAYDPSIYEYTYLLSPAQTWAEFGSLDIFVDTPYYMIDSEKKGFEWKDSGYDFHSDGLPEGELTFTLSAEKEPKPPNKGKFLVGLGIVAFAISGGIIILCVVLAVKLLKWIVRNIRKK